MQTFSAFLLGFVLLVGCNTKPKTPGAHLAGVVEIDGQPVQQGSIAFTPTGSTLGRAVGGHITAGRYDCPYVPLGDLIVQINAVRKTGKKVKVMEKDTEELEDIILSKEHASIKIEVKEDNLNQDFKLKSMNKVK